MSSDEWLARVPVHLHPAARWAWEWCRTDAAVRCAYLGGSIATDRADDASDLDLMVYARPDASAGAFDRLLARVAGDWSVTHRWVLPLPTWHGGRQVFAAVRSADADDEVVLDLVVNDLADGDGVRVDPRRDGTPVVLHDPDRRLEVREHGDDGYGAAAAAAIDQLAQRLPFGRWIVAKSIRREQWPEAYGYYLRFALEPVVLLLRARTTPSRWDFGLRYLDTDLRPADRARLVALLPLASADLEAQAATCFAWQAELLADSAARRQ